MSSNPTDGGRPDDLALGQHLCCLHSGQAEGLGSLASFFAAGYARGDLLLYIHGAHPVRALLEAIEAAGFDPVPALSAQRFDLQALDGLVAEAGPCGLMEALARAVERVRARGLPGLCAVVDMAWIGAAYEEDRIPVDYWDQLDAVLTGQPARGLFLYDQASLSSAVILEALGAHPAVMLAGELHDNPFCQPDHQRRSQQRADRELSFALDRLRERADLRRSLDASELRYQQLFDSLIMGFALHEMIYDEDGVPCDYRFLEVNPAFEALTGLAAQRILGRRVLEVLPGLERVWIERYGRVVLTGEEIRFRMYSSSLERHYEVVAYRPGPDRFVTVFSDITEAVLAEERRLESERRLFESQKLDSLGLLAGGIAHDFNNMLMGVLGNASLAQEDAPPGSALAESLADIESAARNAAGLARQLLAYSGRGRFVVMPVDLRSVVQEMGKLLEASIPKNVVVRYQFGDGVGPVMADVSQLRQVLLNLILNAAQAIGGRSGIITVAISSMDCDADYLETTFALDELEERRYVYLEISDTGVGMDAETQKRIFDPFFTTKDDGRGLGLAAVLGIIRGHAGAIKVYSEQGRGTTFKVLLPEHEGSQEDSLQAEPAGAAARVPAGTLVLVVDDEEHVRRVAARILRRMGFEVLTAEDGREAVAIFRSYADEIELVLLDMMMPRMGGERTFTELRRIRSDVRVLLSSGYNEQEAVVRFVGRGLAGFIQKPYSRVELERVVREALA
jgi:two-component system cell cycle sensor histidine kinase/response regulator CckA